VSKLGAWRVVVFCLFLLLAGHPALSSQDELCPPNREMPFRVAYAQHFAEPEGRTLSLRVSIAARYKNKPNQLYRIGCAIGVQYKDERRWQALVFSDYRVAKTYVAPYPDQTEPPEYLGYCVFDHKHVRCRPWPE